MKTSKFAKALKCIMVMALLVTGAASLTSCFDLTQLTQSKEKIVAVVKTTDLILSKALTAINAMVELSTNTPAAEKIAAYGKTVKVSLEVVQTSVRKIAEFLKIDLTVVAVQSDQTLEELTKQLKEQVSDL